MRTALEAPTDSPAKDTGNASRHRQGRFDGEAGLSGDTNTSGDGREVGKGRSNVNDIALEGVVFMVYAKRL